MKNATFYNSLLYRDKQAVITKANWEKGLYNSLFKQEKRECARIGCGAFFEVKQSDRKKFCSSSCAAKVNNSKRSETSLPVIKKLRELYGNGLSMKEISSKTGLKYGIVVHWMKKYNIPRRSMSEAIYAKKNPNGDPFHIKELNNRRDIELFNIGIGLYLGEGKKRDKHNIAFSNSNPAILKLFLIFLKEICGVKESQLKAQLNIFDDVGLEEAIDLWQKATKIPRSNFFSSVVRKSKRGSYKNRSRYGTFTIYFSNIKLKKFIIECCERSLVKYSQNYADVA